MAVAMVAVVILSLIGQIAIAIINHLRNIMFHQVSIIVAVLAAEEVTIQDHLV